MVLLIDNYDSFVYNLARYVGELGYTHQVIRNDAITVAEIMTLNPSHILISPGPCTPNEAGISLAVVKELGHKIPILGVCLGHQAIGQVYGGKIVQAKKPLHGKASAIRHTQEGLFKNIKNPLTVGRYHSLTISEQNFPNEELLVTAWSDEKEIMAVQHYRYPVFGVQFHPESILTEQGHTLLSNFFVGNTN